MTIDRESLRPAFERSMQTKTSYTLDRRANGEYLVPLVGIAWLGWCAAFESLGEPVAYERHAYDGTDTLARKPSMPRSNLFLSSTPLYRLPEAS